MNGFLFSIFYFSTPRVSTLPVSLFVKEMVQVKDWNFCVLVLTRCSRSADWLSEVPHPAFSRRRKDTFLSSAVIFLGTKRGRRGTAGHALLPTDSCSLLLIVFNRKCSSLVWCFIIRHLKKERKKKKSFLGLLFAFKRCVGVPIWCCWYRTHVLFSFVFLNVIPATSLWLTQWTEPLRSAGTTPAAAHRAQTALSSSHNMADPHQDL